MSFYSTIQALIQKEMPCPFILQTEFLLILKSFLMAPKLLSVFYVDYILENGEKIHKLIALNWKTKHSLNLSKDPWLIMNEKKLMN